MDAKERAKIFAPFSALTGLYELLAEKEKIFCERAVLSEDRKEELDRVTEKLVKGDIIKVRYYTENGYRFVNSVYIGNDKKRKKLLLSNFEVDIEDVYDIQFLKNEVYGIEFSV